MSPPRIAIPGWRQPTAEKFRNYEESVRLAGGEPIRIAPGNGVLDGFDGLLIPGGPDVNPSLYGERRKPHTEKPKPERDAHELGLLRQALARDLPVLAICRGHDLLNVALGGALLQHIEGDGHRWRDDDTSRWHDVTIDPGSHLADVYSDGALLRVNSRHHQAVTPERLAPELTAIAHSPDGLIEAVESRRHRWVVGVQWHPERPEMHPAADSLFAAFVAACRG